VGRSLRPARLFSRWAVAVFLFLVVFAGSLLAWEALGLPPSDAADRLAVALGVAAALSGASAGPLFWWAPRENPSNHREPVAYLSLMKGQDTAVVTSLRPGDSLIGKDPDGEVVVPWDFTRVGRVHARISCDDTDCWVQNLHDNETYVGKEAVPRSPGRRALADGDLICLGGPLDSEPPPCTYMFIKDPSRVRPPTTERDSKHKTTTVLVLMSGPGRDGALQLDAELRAIDQAVIAARGRDQVSLKVSLAVSLPGLAQAVLQHKPPPSVIHFSGCGSGQDGITLAADDPSAGLTSPQELGQFFQMRAPWVSCVVLNACYAPEQGAAIARHVGYVIGTPASVPENAAITFSAAFYGALADELSVNKAFARATNAMNRRLPPGERVTPVLLVQRETKRQRAVTRRREGTSGRKEASAAKT
jgi:hypothetical protein